MVRHFEFSQLTFFRSHISLKPQILSYSISSRLAIWHGLPDISDIKVNKAILVE